MDHTVTPTIEEFRARITALETALTIASSYLRHRDRSVGQPGRCLPECPKCRAEAVLAARNERGSATNALESFEEEAEMFYKATGFMAPGKSESPAAIGQTDFERYEVRSLMKKAWDAGRKAR